MTAQRPCSTCCDSCRTPAAPVRCHRASVPGRRLPREAGSSMPRAKNRQVANTRPESCSLLPSPHNPIPPACISLVIGPERFNRCRSFISGYKPNPPHPPQLNGKTSSKRQIMPAVPESLSLVTCQPVGETLCSSAHPCALSPGRPMLVDAPLRPTPAP
ncbi:hypothetical protein cypCar_00040609 [Cyprinus carpio]|nr:hypothetical protein cypCar_00040609 [Cyprinus carpio]